jgi:16S rRNA (cytosine967-C5)-methyltransferase
MAPSPPLSRLLLATADAVAAVRAGRSLTDALVRTPDALRPAVLALASDVLRHLGSALVLRQHLAAKAPPPPVDALLLSALALLWPRADRQPYDDHTLVDQAVGATRARIPGAAGFVNAVLRRFVRERAVRVAQARQDAQALWNHPLWWIERVRHDWPSQWQALLESANQPPPLVLRVNVRRGDVDAYVQRLAAAGIAARALGAQAVWLPHPRPVGDLPGFDDGEVSVQDLSAQRAAPLLLGAGLAPGARVLDACAAPGGKTAHLLELADLELTALDADAGRLQRVRDTLARLHLQARTLCADARDTARWWDGRPFDAILLDAPCTASGIVRRHPDIRWLRRPEDLTALARLQAELLDALWPLVAPGGCLLYATCSIFRIEGSQQIDAFLQRHAGDNPQPDGAAPGHLLPLPENSNTHVVPPVPVGDGFFYALLRRP